MRRCDRVIAARHHHHLAVAYGDRLVEIARVGIDALEGEPLWGIEPVVIGLLERGFLTRHIAVVLVRRIARPIPARRDDLDDKQAVGGLALGQDVAHKALVSAAAAHLARHRSEEHTSEIQTLMRTSYAVF